MSVPKITILLPFYQAKDTLASAVNSITDQTFTAFSLRLIDNNATDGSRELAEKFTHQDPRITLHSAPQQGIAYALNAGLQSTCTPYIARMDADDIAHPERLEKQYAYLESHKNIGLLGCGVQPSVHFSGGMKHYVSWSNSLCTHNQIQLNRFVESPIVHPTFMFRSALLGGSAQLYQPGDFPEDYELLLRWLSEGVEMAKLPDQLLFWNDLPNRLSRTDPRCSTENFFKLKAHYLAKWLTTRAINRPIWVWGAGKQSRRYAQWLAAKGVNISGYIDIKANKNLALPCIHYSQLPLVGQIFVISYVNNRGAGKEISKYLQQHGYVEGHDFLMAA